MCSFVRLVLDRVYVCQGMVHLPEGEKNVWFVPEEAIQYYPLCDDFGPMNMSSVLKYVTQLQEDLDDFPENIFYYPVENGRRALTNAVFMLGCFMILKLEMSLKEVEKHFDWVESSMIEGFRDATFQAADFRLTLQDCWLSILRGQAMGWIDDDEACSGVWGKIDIGEYDHYENPLNGDLHVVVPGKFIAFKGPMDLGGKEFQDDEHGFRNFSPEYYREVLQHLGVTDVVRLNEPRYDSNSFSSHGLAFHDLEFEDCSSPPDDITRAFFSICDAAQGLVAVHCKAGLGRTGTLIALYLMRSHGFTAREAMAWLRIMRPGSVIGEQQQFLRLVEKRGFAAPAAPAADPPRHASSSRACAVRAAEVAAGMMRRGSWRGMRSAAAAEPAERPTDGALAVLDCGLNCS